MSKNLIESLLERFPMNENDPLAQAQRMIVALMLHGYKGNEVRIPPETVAEADKHIQSGHVPHSFTDRAGRLVVRID